MSTFDQIQAIRDTEKRVLDLLIKDGRISSSAYATQEARVEAIEDVLQALESSRKPLKYVVYYETFNSNWGMNSYESFSEAVEIRDERNKGMKPEARFWKVASVEEVA